MCTFHKRDVDLSWSEEFTPNQKYICFTCMINFNLIIFNRKKMYIQKSTEKLHLNSCFIGFEI